MAVVDYFLKIDGVEGESQDAKHPKEIQLQSWGFGETQQGTFSAGGGGGAGKVSMDDFTFVMSTNKASPLLFQKCANGEHIKSAILTVRKAGKEQLEYLKWTFTNLLVSAYNTSGTAGSDLLPIDQISLNFEKVQIDYKEQNPDGTLMGAVTKFYDLKQSQGG
jgi:type VI secretion system secreted protein Hcp